MTLIILYSIIIKKNLSLGLHDVVDFIWNTVDSAIYLYTNHYKTPFLFFGPEKKEQSFDNESNGFLMNLSLLKLHKLSNEIYQINVIKWSFVTFFPLLSLYRVRSTFDFIMIALSQ